MRGGRAAEIAAILILALGTWLGFATAGLPGVVPASAPLAAFSAERAMADLHVITAEPHPVGTEAHDRLRDYLVDRLRTLGMDEVHVQSATGFNTLEGPLAATVANVVARKKGTAPGPALLLMAHYDAVPRSYGAGDDGAGVAAILETVRAVGNSPPLDRDLIVVLSDAEENGLLGAEAFVNLHPWAKEVGAVLNFEGRGTGGPVYMFQTSQGNTPLVDALAAGVPGARANSLTGEIYRHLPSDTDLSIWLHSGMAVGALNFAHVGGYQHYHTPLDNGASLDPRVLQQMGDYALGLTRTLGHVKLDSLRTIDAIYFNAPLLGVMHYPASWALIVGVDGMAILVVVAGLALRRRTITPRGVGRGAIALVLSLVIPAVVTMAGWGLIKAIHPAFGENLQGDPYNSQWYLLGFVAITIAIVIEIQRRATVRATPREVAVAPGLLWGVLGIVVAIMLPGASYLFAWPVFAAAMCASWWGRDERAGKHPSAWLALLALPALTLWPPLIRALEIALTADKLVFCSLLVALVVSILSLPLQLAGRTRSWIVGTAIVVGISALIGAEIGAGFSAIRKRPDSLARLVDADTHQGWWISYDLQPDSWNAQLLGERPTHRSFRDLGPRVGGVLASAPSSAAAVESPVQVVASQPVDGGRQVHLRIAHAGVGQLVALYVDSGVVVREMTINGRLLAEGQDDRYLPQYHMGRDGTVLRYYGVPVDGIDLRFTIRSAAETGVRIVSAIQGLPDGPGGAIPSRPTSMMSKPFVPTDMTITGWTIRL